MERENVVPAVSIAPTVPVVAEAPAVPIAPAAATASRRVGFRDIEYAIPDFTGDDRTHDVGDFVKGFEDIMSMVNADDPFKLLALRRKINETAKCLTRAPEAVTYNGLRDLLLKEFGGKLTMVLRPNLWI